MSVLNLYNVIRDSFSEITKKADVEHVEIWDEIDPEFAYSWFGSLANALNKEMMSGVLPSEHKELLLFISNKFLNGDDEVKNCIDVSFTENLFWEVPSEKAAPYWQELPSNLQELYVKFHGHKPC